MLQTGRIEEVGSGIRNVSKYLPLYSQGSKFEFIEDDMFMTNVYLEQVENSWEKKFGENKVRRRSSEKSSEKIISLLLQNPTLSAKEMAEIIGISPRAIEKQIAKLKNDNMIKRIGPDKGGYWKVIKSNSLD